MSISVIIPALNEASAIGACIQSVRLQEPAQIIVVDGGSTDATLAAATQAHIVLPAARGRASQMNVGAARATGDILLFLHADCELAAGALAAARKLLSNGAVAAGCFTMTVRAAGTLYRSIDACASARVRLTGLIYGDQGLFVRRRDFERIDGFPQVRLMEDVLISQILRQIGRIVVARPRILVSPRRWQKSGLLRQTLRNWTLTSLAAAGIHPDRLAKYYPIVR